MREMTRSKRVFVALALIAGVTCWDAQDVRAEAPVADAAKARNMSGLRALLKRGAAVSAPQADGATALHWAAHWNDVTTVKLLLASGAKVDAVNDYGVRPLQLACVNGSAAVVGELLKAGADPKRSFPTGETPLMAAALTGDVETVKVLLASGAVADEPEPTEGQTALMWAAADGHSGVVRALLVGGASATAETKRGYTPLLYAARSGDLATVRSLMETGASVDEAASDGVTALMIATIRGDKTLAEFLLKSGANPNAGLGFFPLHWVAGEWGQVVSAEGTDWSNMGGLKGRAQIEFAEMLLAHGADVKARATATPRIQSFNRGGGELDGATPFLIAARATAIELMKLLRDNGADLVAPTKDGSTPLMYASGLGHETPSGEAELARAMEAVRLCLEAKADVNAQNAAGDTALHGAAYRGAEALVRLLVERGAKVDVPNKRGWTPRTIAEGIAFPATNSRHAGTLAALISLGAAPSSPNVNRSSTAAELNLEETR